MSIVAAPRLTSSQIRGIAPHRRKYTWMPSGWLQTDVLNGTGGGSEFLTIGVPDDFLAVRVGFANITTTPWAVTKAKACASSAWNDMFNPLDASAANRPSSAWSNLTFAMNGADDPRIVTAAGAATAITVAANTTDASSGETGNAAWTWTDWVPCASVGADPTTGMRVLMLRALVPSSQTVVFTNGSFSGWWGAPTINNGYDLLIGGFKNNSDRVTTPSVTTSDGTSVALIRANNPTGGVMMAMVQVLTRNGGVVGMTTGDSHHMGTTTTAAFNSYLAQALTAIGKNNVGTTAVGLANCAVGGMTSQQFFPRLESLLAAVQPSFVIMPGWTFNELDGATNADAVADNVFFSRLQASADRVRAAGSVPIFLTPFPRNAGNMTATQVTPWLALRQSILAMANSGELVVDATSLLGHTTAGALDGTYIASMTTDNVHPNDAGHAAVAAALTPVIKRICGL